MLLDCARMPAVVRYSVLWSWESRKLRSARLRRLGTVKAVVGLTAPVFEHLGQPALLAQEIEEDIAHGLIGKPAIHPSQIALIEQHYRVHHNDMEGALRIMDRASPAVFKMHDSMCEVATHRAWAHSVVEQARVFGIRHADTEIDANPPLSAA